MTYPTSTENSKFYIESAYKVSVTDSLFSDCGTSLYGGVFYLALGTPFYDLRSTYQFNAGAFGGVFNCLSCTMNMV